jgi:hypothetical protein
MNVGETAFEELFEADDDGTSHTGHYSPSSSATEPSGGTEPVKEAAGNGGAAESETGQATKTSKRGSQKARKSQVDLLKTLAVEWRGENGVERLENRIGKPVVDLTRAEADEWIDRLTPEGRE